MIAPARPDDRNASLLPQVRAAAGRGAPASAVYARLASSSFLRTGLPFVGVLIVASFFRFWQLTSVGLNSDEAVYTGTAASISGDDTMRSLFPIFRAHPVLFQMLLSLTIHGEVNEWTTRAVPAAIGVATVAVTYLLGSRLYGRGAGLVAALLLAVMPYHVIVSRQVLLDGLMTLCATGTLYCLVRFSESVSQRWLLAAAGMMGATILSKETSAILLGAVYAFFALSPSVRVKSKQLLLAAGALIVIVAAYPVALSESSRVGTGQHYLLWQLFRRSNHSFGFYFSVVPTAVGLLVLALAFAGMVWLRAEYTWRERLLLAWITVPVVFFTVWPVKGYQYLLPIAPVLAVLAGRTLSRIPLLKWFLGNRRLGRSVAIGVSLLVAVSLAVPTWNRIEPSTSGTFLAGTGGVPGGREAGEWVRKNVPLKGELLALGPSMGNILEFYGHRKVMALSVSSNPQNRNPSYLPVPNPDSALRQGQFQYLVWDSYTARRSPFYAKELAKLKDKYHGVQVFTANVSVRTGAGSTPVPVVVIYQVRAA